MKLITCSCGAWFGLLEYKTGTFTRILCQKCGKIIEVK